MNSYDRKSQGGLVVVLGGCLVLLVLAGCGYLSMTTGQWRAQVANMMGPSQVLQRELDPASCSVLYGILRGDSSTLSRPMLVAAITVGENPELVDSYRIDRMGYYSLYLPQGRYRIRVVSDLDSNGVFEHDECVGAGPDSLNVHKADDSTSALLAQNDIMIDYQEPFTDSFAFSVKIPPPRELPHSDYYPPGAIRSLDDEIFSPKYGELGLFSPSAFLQHAGIYFYALDERDMRKIPVVFVHGMTGTPRNFEYLLGAIDRDRFDPWFFYYPSGERLTKISDIFSEIFFSGNIIDLRGRKLVVIAHSMGGVVVRAAINNYAAQEKKDFLKLFISMATPYGGDDFAARGVQTAPVVIPVWQDIAAESDFLVNMRKTPLPEHIDFHLLFAYRGGGNPLRIRESSDGTILLRSQLQMAIQSEASERFGFDTTHSGILRDERVREHIAALLESM